MMRQGIPILTATAVVAALWLTFAGPTELRTEAAEESKPLKALIITGGCCHDYKKQPTIISEGVAARGRVTFDVYHNGKHFHDLPEGWAKKYDVVIHNQCWAGYNDKAKVDRFIQEQKDAGVGVVVVHCAMHTFRKKGVTENWDKLVGVESSSHGPKFRINIKVLKPDHPIMKTVPADWLTKNGELYRTKPLTSATPLAEGSRNGKGPNVCIWVNQRDKTRTFGTTLGHHNETMQDPVWLDMFTRGLLWTVGQLGDDGKPKAGYAPNK